MWLVVFNADNTDYDDDTVGDFDITLGEHGCSDSGCYSRAPLSVMNQEWHDDVAVEVRVFGGDDAGGVANSFGFARKIHPI